MSNFITKRLRKQKEMNDELASSADSAANAVGSVGNVVLQAKTMGAAPDISKQGPLNKYEDPAYVAQADQNAFIMQNFVQGLKEGEDEADKKKGVFEKRAYLKKEYTGNKNSYEGFQKKGLLNKVEGEDEKNKRNALIDEMATSRLTPTSSLEEVEDERKEAEEFLNDVNELNPTSVVKKETFDYSQSSKNLRKKYGGPHSKHVKR